MTKKELSNLEISAKCEASRQRIKKEADQIIEIINHEIKKLKILSVENILNKTNEELLKRKIEILFRLRGDIIKAWKKLIDDFEVNVAELMEEKDIKDSIEDNREILEHIGRL